MRIAVITTSFPDKEHNYIWAWMQELSRRGFWIDIFTEKINFSARQTEYFNDPLLWSRIHTFANPIHLFDMTPDCFYQSISSLRFPSRIANMVAYLRKNERKTRTVFRKTFEYLPWIKEKYDLVHINHSRIAARRLELGEIIQSRTLVSFRGQDLTLRPGLFGPIFDRADHIHFISKYLYEQAVQQGYNKDNYSIISLIVDTSFFSPENVVSQPQSSFKNNHAMIFTSAKLRWQKGYEFAIKAVDLLIKRGWKIDYFIAGDGENSEEVEYTIRDLHLEDAVHLLGWLDISEVRNWMRKADLYLLCSVEDGFNNSVLQAQACGLPCVVTDANGLPENIEDGVTGLLASRRDPHDIADKIEALLSDPKRRIEMGHAGRERAVKLFDISIVNDQFEALYRRLCGGNG